MPIWINVLIVLAVLWVVAGIFLTWSLYRSTDGDPIMFGSPFSFIFLIIFSPGVELWKLAYGPFVRPKKWEDVTPASPEPRRRHPWWP